jgi:pyrroloquinoline quinone (PQQ) biosynthesis protein C
MGIFDELTAEFRAIQACFLNSPGLRRVQEGGIGVTHYAAYLMQVFHHTRENPQIQALATVYFRGHRRAAIKRFFCHASSEIGHEQLALDDLKALGMSVEALPFQNPLPQTTALISFPFYQIHNLNPVGYLGYLYFLEFLPTGSGSALMNALARAGVPRGAMRFLHDHSTIDVAHNRMMETYANVLITGECELRSAIYAMRVTGALYADMVEAALANADRPMDYGLSPEECASGLAPSREHDEQPGRRPAGPLAGTAGCAAGASGRRIVRVPCDQRHAPVNLATGASRER